MVTMTAKGARPSPGHAPLSLGKGTALMRHLHRLIAIVPLETIQLPDPTQAKVGPLVRDSVVPTAFQIAFMVHVSPHSAKSGRSTSLSAAAPSYRAMG
jgi:hypothetical protein